MSAHVQAPVEATAARPAAVRMFGPMQLLRFLGKSERCTAWRAVDLRVNRELVLVLPRAQPADAASRLRWVETLQRVSRLQHPQLAQVLEIGVQDAWPYVAYAVNNAATLTEHLPASGLSALDAAALVTQVLRGLALAHDAGFAHLDLQPFLLFVGDNGALQITGLGVACEMPAGLPAHTSPEPVTPAGALREATERDVLASGVLLHGLLVGRPALDEPDIGRVIQRLPPCGREVVRLPWTLSQPLSEALRAINNRITERQARQRYRSARTLLRALEGWAQTEASQGGGPMALLADKLRLAGVLPSSPGAAAQAARLSRMHRERTDELAEVVMLDLGLAFELLRMVNSTQVRGAQAIDNGPVLTVRRAIALLGLDGVRRAAVALRPWPGPLDESGAAALQRLIETCKQAGRLAVALRPAGYNGEVVYLLTLLQSLGRLVAQYHFAEEALQIRRLMRPAPAATKGDPEEPGMSEEAASFAVLGADTEALAAAVAHQWGLDHGALAMLRRMPLAVAVHAADDDRDMLRCVASCANEAVDALQLPKHRVLAALQTVVLRYGRLLNISLRDLQQALLTAENSDPGVVAGSLSPDSQTSTGSDGECIASGLHQR